MPGVLRRQILLVGGGHAHVEVVRRFATHEDDLDVTLVSCDPRSPYSGLLPGFVAGAIALDDLEIDLPSLCRHSNVRFVAGTATRLDLENRILRLADGRMLAFDLVSLDVGSQPLLPKAAAGIATKPIAGFAGRIAAIAARLNAESEPFGIAVVGTGLAGIEIAFALRARSERARGSLAAAAKAVPITLLGRESEILPDRSAIARRLIHAALLRRAITVKPGVDIVSSDNGTLRDCTGAAIAVADEIVWATSGAAPSWLAPSGLDLDAAGFVRVDETLRSLSHPFVFAAGDVAALPSPRPKAGVFAVRAGPILAHNLRVAAIGGAARRFRPQRRWLAIVSVADGSAIATKYGLAVQGRWVQRWKNWIDRRFVERYKDPAPGKEKRCV